MAKKKASGSHETLARKKQEKSERLQKKRRVRLLQFGAIAVVAAAVVVVLAVRANRSEQFRQDLSQLGNGVPAAVQVWDVSCPICNQNRANVARIEDDYSDDDLLIRYVDVRTDEGVRFASQYTDRRRQTMLLFDGEGELVDIVTGPIEQQSMRILFDDLAGR